ncbi:MAG: hypothetical protein WB007_03875 [Candidatus Acidiferrales bacterium]
MVYDPIFGAKPSPTARGGFDALGFRNRSVPKTADIVAIGDSQTYGNAATMDDSWPYALGRMLGRPVYSMALGGFGPNKYLELLRSKALNLKPRMVICGLSMTDDFDNAYHLTYGLDYWAYLRSSSVKKVDFDTWDTGHAPESRQKKIRVWLSQHSVVYQLVVHTGWGDRLKGNVQIRNAAQLYPGAATSLILPEQNIEEAFQPTANLHGLDQDSESVREGMRITFEILKEMNEICRKGKIQFVVVVIPTKEMVFEQSLEHNSKIALSDVVEKVLTNERLALDRTFQFLADTNIPYVDPLPGLQKSAGLELFAKSAGDMHPNKNGYKVIAESVAEYLKQNATEKQPAASPQ